jgi:hypothetical protein
MTTGTFDATALINAKASVVPTTTSYSVRANFSKVKKERLEGELHLQMIRKIIFTYRALKGT